MIILFLNLNVSHVRILFSVVSPLGFLLKLLEALVIRIQQRQRRPAEQDADESAEQRHLCGCEESR